MKLFINILLGLFVVCHTSEFFIGFVFKSMFKLRKLNKRVIILYFESILNAYYLLSQKLWVSLIKFMIELTTSVRKRNTYLIYFRNII